MDTGREMQIREIAQGKEQLTIVTTGAKYIINTAAAQGRIDCYQRLNRERLVASLKFNFSFSALSVEKQDCDSCILHQHMPGRSYMRLEINGDSLLDIHSPAYKMGKPLCATVNVSGSDFVPYYTAENNGNILLLDDVGGIGVYAYKGFIKKDTTNFVGKELTVDYQAATGDCRLFVCVCPPRKFNHAQSVEERICHNFLAPFAWQYPYPADETIEELAKYTNILVLHNEIWQGKYTRAGKPVNTPEEHQQDACYCCFDYVPVDEQELKRVINKARSLGMKIIPFTSPYYSLARDNDFLDKMAKMVDKYGMDGVYFDCVSNDMADAYQMVKSARRMLKDKILYVHLYHDPLMSRHLFCPFIDAYADYTLRAEDLESFSDDFLRYIISGYNVSNSIGYICYNACSPDFMAKLIDKALQVKARFHLGWPEGDIEKLLKKEYFPKLRQK